MSCPTLQGSTGEVSVVSEDGSLLWFHQELGGGRIMIRKADRHQIRRTSIRLQPRPTRRNTRNRASWPLLNE
jgi:hypothetical protein